MISKARPGPAAEPASLAPSTTPSTAAGDQPGGAKSRRARRLGLVVLLLMVLGSTGYAVRLLGDNPRLATPPAVEGGLILLVPKARIAEPISLPVALSATESDNPLVTVAIDAAGPTALLVSGSFLPEGPVSYVTFDGPGEAGDGPGMPALLGRQDLPSVATEVWLKSFADQDLLGSLQDVRDGKADAAIPGLSSGAHVIEVPEGDGYVRWRVQHPFTLTGRGSQAGAVPAVGTPSEATIVDSVLASAVFAQVFEGESPADVAKGLAGPSDPAEQARWTEELRRVEEEKREIDDIMSDVFPALTALAARDRQQPADGGASPFPPDALTVAGQDWFIPRRLTSSLSMGSIGDGQKMDSAVPSVLGRADELVWSSPADNGQIPRVSWTASDPAGQQSSSDALFFAALLFSVPVAGVLLALERLIDR